MSLPPDIPRTPMTFAAALLLLLPLAAGCANPGPPRPPSLHLPEIVSDLSAERVGSEVRLHWTTSGKTTDGISVTGHMTARICRSVAQSACDPVLSIPVKEGSSEAVDPLPPTLTADPQVLLEYRVEILNDRQHSAGPSTPAFAAAGTAPPAITGLRIQATEQGAELQWTQGNAGDTIELDRLHHVASAPSSRRTSTRLPTGGKEPAEMRFHAAKPNANPSPFQPDAGGSLDQSAHRGETYTYTAQRIRAVVLQGHLLEIRSGQSAAVAVVMRDSFPPKPPTGLEAILSGRTGAPPGVDLSWTPNGEPDLAGYVLYRQELGQDGAATGARVRLTTTPVPTPGFHDAAITPGHSYSYAVTAVDGAGNESAPGASVREDVPLP